MASTEEDAESAPVCNLGATDVPGLPIFMEALEMSSITEEQSACIASVWLFEMKIRQKSLSGYGMRREFAYMFPTASLFSAALLHIPSVHRSVRDFLDANGANMTPHSSRRVINTPVRKRMRGRPDADEQMSCRRRCAYEARLTCR